MGNFTVNITVNGTSYSREIEARLLLVHFIREDLSLTGTHIGCDTTSCGACTVLMDGVAVKSCTVFAATANGKSISTIEGVAQGGQLHPLQETRVFLALHAMPHAANFGCRRHADFFSCFHLCRYTSRLFGMRLNAVCELSGLIRFMVGHAVTSSLAAIFSAAY